MEAAKPVIVSETPIKDNLKEYFKKILAKHLDDRAYNETKIKNWADNILSESKEYFIKQFPDYDLFLICFICERNVYFTENCKNISITATDASDFVNFQSDSIYCGLNFFYYKHYILNYNINDFECDIIRKGNETLLKHLEDRKYNVDKIGSYNENINKEHMDYIVGKCNKLRSYCINKIFQNPIKGKYYFNYLSHGKDIHRAIFQSYQNDELICTHDIFFFK